MSSFCSLGASRISWGMVYGFALARCIVALKIVYVFRVYLRSISDIRYSWIVWFMFLFIDVLSMPRAHDRLCVSWVSAFDFRC